MKDFDHALFKKRLKEVSKKDKSDAERAKKIGTTPSTISKWFSGSAVPKVIDLMNISDVYGCTIDYLVGNESAGKARSYTPRDFCKTIVDMDNHFTRIVFEKDTAMIGLDYDGYPAERPVVKMYFAPEFCTNDKEMEYYINQFLLNYLKVKDIDIGDEEKQAMISALINKVNTDWLNDEVARIEDDIRRQQEMDFYLQHGYLDAGMISDPIPDSDTDASFMNLPNTDNAERTADNGKHKKEKR